jgi:hypothetical protein
MTTVTRRKPRGSVNVGTVLGDLEMGGVSYEPAPDNVGQIGPAVLLQVVGEDLQGHGFAPWRVIVEQGGQQVAELHGAG